METSVWCCSPDRNDYIEATPYQIIDADVTGIIRFVFHAYIRTRLSGKCFYFRTVLGLKGIQHCQLAGEQAMRAIIMSGRSIASDVNRRETMYGHLARSLS